MNHIQHTEFGIRPSRTGALICPHCKCVGQIRTSRPITDQHRELHYQCSNVKCGHTWRASLSYDYGIVPSAIPDPKIDLPIRIPSRQQVLEALRPRDDSQPELFDGEAEDEPPI